jgi:protein arginine kinase activator
VSLADTRQCAFCGLSLSEFKKRNCAGCEACYELFEPELMVMIGDMQRAEKHCGKIPERELSRAELIELKTALLQAVKKQAFEEAAELRDRIRELEREQ